jgi:hypothetical protein
VTEPLDVWKAIDQEREALVEDMAQIDAVEWDPQSLCADWKVREVVGTVGRRNLPPFVKSACELADIICHGEDVRRPLGLRREVPVEVSMVAAEFLKNDRATGTPKRIKGQMQSLVLAMAVRRVALDELSGDGLAELRTRVGTA